MKKVSLITLTIIPLCFFASCSSTPGADKFMGEWITTDTAIHKDQMIIKRQNDAIVLLANKDKTVALYNGAKNELVIYFWTDTVAVSYIEKNGHLLVNGSGHEFKRVK